MRRVLVFIAVVLVAGFSVGCEKTKPVTDAVTPQAQYSATPKPATTFAFEIQNGQVRAPSNLKVKQGQQVVITVKSDVADEVHVHGYDLMQEVSPTEDAEIRFTANTAGRFEMELESSKLALGALEVEPK